MIERLEEKIAYLERAVDELSDLVVRQNNEIARLTRHVQQLRACEAAREAENSGGVILGDERPPHD